VDIVDLFRKSEEVFPLVQEAIRIGAKVVWMQDGVEHEAAAQAARAAGLKVVMNDCLLRVHRRLNGPFRKTITTC
jgi:predicted CoA-binding protein